MQTLRTAWRRAPAWLGPAVLVTALWALAYLPFLNSAGYYRDDWHVAWAGYNVGPHLIAREHSIDRPVMGLLYAWVYQRVGDSPRAWALEADLLRLAGAWAALGLFRALWPRRRFETTAAAALFTIYPGFLQLPVASSYSNHLFALASGLASLACTAWALRSSRRWARALLTLLSAPLALGCYLIMEHMVGLELVRGCVLALLLWAQSGRWPRWREARSAAEGLWRLGLAWAVNLAAFGGFLVWRLFKFDSVRSATDVNFLAAQYQAEPLRMLGRLISETLRDVFETVVLGWGAPFARFFSNANVTDLALGAGLGLAAAALVWWALRGDARPAGDAADETIDLRWMLAAGWVWALLTLAPVVLSNRSVSFENTFDRYTMAAMPGAALAVVSAATLSLRGRWRVALLAALAWAAVFTHYQNGVYHRQYWEYQRQLWWQLSWRAPGLEDKTLLMASLPAGVRLQEDYEIWGPANLLYHPRVGELKISAEILNDETLSWVESGVVDHRPFRTMDIQRDFSRLLLATLPEGGACLHVIDGAATAGLSSKEEPLARLAAPYSSLERIDVNAPAAQPVNVIFGEEPARGWCYVYQQAGLAGQRGDLAALRELALTAQEQGLRPVDASEWLAFGPVLAGDDPAFEPLRAQAVEAIGADTVLHSRLCGAPTAPAWACAP